MTQKKSPSFAEIVAGLQSSDSKVRRASTYQIKDLNEQEIDKDLLLSLLVNVVENDEKIEVRTAAIYRLSVLGYRGAVEPLLKFAKSENFEVKWAALNAIVYLRDDRCLPFLFEEARSKSSSTRQRGIEGLYRFRNEQIFQVLLDALENDPVIEVRETAAYCLGKYNDPRAIEPLLIALEKVVDLLIADKYTFDMRGEIAYALARFKESRLFEPVVALVKNPDEGVRSYGIGALGELGDARGVEPLLAILTDPEQPSYLRMEAAQGLAELKNSEPKVITALIDAMKVVPQRRNIAPLAQTAASTLSKLGEPGLQALLETAQSSDNFQRSQALIVLSYRKHIIFEDEQVIKTLKVALKNTEGLTDRAKEALVKWEIDRNQPES